MAAAPSSNPAQLPLAASGRVAWIDLVRGAVMILMAIDHVRVFSGLPAGGPTAGIFFTRWITHFCAPAFVFLAGTSAYFYGRKHGDLSRFLLTRGLWLVLLELTFLRVAWTFNLDFSRYLMAGVIWVIGWSLILLAGLSRLPLPLVGGFGLAVIAGHNLLDSRMGALIDELSQHPGDRLASLWKSLYVGFSAGPMPYGESGSFWVLYSLVPWVGVMAAGFAFGKILTLPRVPRDRICLTLGLGAIALFLVLRGFNLYGDPRPWSAQIAAGGGRATMPTLFAFLNTTKYPASLQFLLMTLGPILALAPLLERATGALARAITVFGRVPFFYYILHIPLIHLLAIVVARIRLGVVAPWLFADHPMGAPPAPDGYAWSLPLLYLIWAVTIALLYPACRWFAALKTRRGDAWLRYL